MTADCQCGQTGWIETVESRAVKRAVKNSETGVISIQDETIIVPVAVPCPICNNVDRKSTDSLHIPARWNHVSLENFETLDKTNLVKAKRMCLDYIDNFGKSSEMNSLLITGPPGVGKTHLAISVLKKIAQSHRVTSRFVDFRDVLSAIRKGYSNQGFWSDEVILDQFAGLDFLVVDELGCEKMTSWVREIVHRLIIPRYNNNLPTIFTTNFTDESVSDKKLPVGKDESFSTGRDDQEELEDRIGGRLRSKLKEMCQLISIAPADYRDSFVKGEDRKGEAAFVVAVGKVRQQFYRLSSKTRSGFFTDASRYQPVLALQFPEAMAAWIFGRSKNIVPPTMPVRLFIDLFQRNQ